MVVPNPSILFVDAYDSFSNNIIALLKTELNATVRVLKIDDSIEDADFHDELRRHDAVVCGPGPGTPYKSEDVGIMTRIWKLNDEQMIPVLGICLGFQSMALAFGARVRKLPDPQHGMIRRIEHAGEHNWDNTIFSGVGEIRATLYQSLCVDISSAELTAGDAATSQWLPSSSCPEIRPLAWVPANSSTSNGPILQGIQHVSKPFWALQYHPESICTNAESKKVVRNWFRAAQDWNEQHKRRRSGNEPPSLVAAAALKPPLLSLGERGDIRNKNDVGYGSGPVLDSIGLRSVYSCRTIKRVALTVPDIIAALKVYSDNVIVLESTNAECSPSSLGRYSIIGLGVDNALRFEYKVGNDLITAHISKPCTNGNSNLQTDINVTSYGGVWAFLSEFMEKRNIEDTSENDSDNHAERVSPFWGGLMGYTSYEMGLQGIGVGADFVSSSAASTRPDLCFAWIEDSIVIDHKKDLIHIQHLHSPNSQKSNILSDIVHKLESHEKSHASSGKSSESIFNQAEIQRPSPNFSATNISLPSSPEYESKVRLCQEHIGNGDSYELCLTDQTCITLAKRGDNQNSAWDLYLKLRSRQPAPFAAFVRLGSATLVSSSPERFLKWDSNGRCELRPMKGTVKKTAEVSTLAQAEKLLKVEKEQAENLMIVDLVRHDLHGIVGSGNVQVPKLMVVEEYRSVFQMISVVEGQIRNSGGKFCNHRATPLPLAKYESLGEEGLEAREKRYTGMDILAASLPPGSMTGAPKKRSCEILQDIEKHRPRSLYSGVVGYMDIGGRGDFSVIIRSLFRWDDEVVVAEAEEHEVWHIGAGGAVTSLSTPVGEREEMETKLAGTVGLFDLAR